VFEQAAAQFFRLWTFVGRTDHEQTPAIHGLGCRIAPGLVLTAAHVYAGGVAPTVGIDGDVWVCSVAAEWADRDIAVLRAERKIRSFDPDRNSVPPYPQLATDLPRVGMQLGCMAWLRLREPDGNTRGRTYFGQGHVAYFEEGAHGELLFAMQGPTIEKGFSGGPVFSDDGRLFGVLVQAVQHAPNLSEQVLQIDSLALLSPVGKIAAEIAELIDRDLPVPELPAKA
jgi:S1-C subfamily serine protease